ncbi:hypothetical protein OIDMADRAFT_30392 [Oidiodendron maius Zn]|uniref:Uncharacterized protein n=1 Tax=Oidiodendron maius (strain Zn) TaxID=913774 RepID=A0A0C3CLX7_OIDMZ|nr:hypothetical protein OIDMADRAFT_30392 [Oidiodendron maius Zn]
MAEFSLVVSCCSLHLMKGAEQEGMGSESFYIMESATFNLFARVYLHPSPYTRHLNRNQIEQDATPKHELDYYTNSLVSFCSDFTPTGHWLPKKSKSSNNPTRSMKTTSNLAKTITRRTPPTITPVTVAPQTALIKGSAQTTYLVYSGQTGNSKITETIQGTPTILPLWTCDPTLSASACKSCPTSSASGQQPCPTNFNYILVIPALAVVGGIVPPPEGLPTLSIGWDGNPTPDSSVLPTVSETSTTSSTSSSTTISISVPCTKASITGSSWATEVPTTSSWIPPTGTPGPSITAPLPVLPLTDSDPAHPTIYGYCGGSGGDPYYSPFYQFGNSFSRNAGLNAVAKFCSDMIAASAVAGPSGVTGTVSGSSTKTAIPQLIRSYDNGDGSGKVMVRIDSDVTNYSQAQTNVTCPDNWLYDIHLAGYSSCYQYLGTLTRSLISVKETWRNNLYSLLLLHGTEIPTRRAWRHICLNEFWG